VSYLSRAEEVSSSTVDEDVESLEGGHGFLDRCSARLCITNVSGDVFSVIDENNRAFLR